MLEPGYYLNMFEVTLLSDEAEFMIAERSQYPSLEELRGEIESSKKKIRLYAPTGSSKVFGYGEDKEWLASKGFTKEVVKFTDQPKLTGRVILEGIVDKAKELGYYPMPESEKGRVILLNEKEFMTTQDGNVCVYKAYDIRVIYLRDVISGELKYLFNRRCAVPSQK